MLGTTTRRCLLLLFLYDGVELLLLYDGVELLLLHDDGVIAASVLTVTLQLLMDPRREDTAASSLLSMNGVPLG